MPAASRSEVYDLPAPEGPVMAIRSRPLRFSARMIVSAFAAADASAAGGIVGLGAAFGGSCAVAAVVMVWFSFGLCSSRDSRRSFAFPASSAISRLTPGGLLGGLAFLDGHFPVFVAVNQHRQIAQ